MNWKRFAASATAVFVAKAAVGAVAFGLLLEGVFDTGSPVFRPEGQEQHGTAMIGEVTWAIAFTYVFVRGVQRRGVAEGLRFGLLVWGLYFVPMSLGILGYFAVDTTWALLALAVGLIESLLCGVSAALVYRPPSHAD